MGGWTFVRRPVVWAGRRAGEQDRPAVPETGCPVDGPGDRGRFTDPAVTWA